MINIKKTILVIFFFLQSCMEPDTEKLWDISIENIFETQGGEERWGWGRRRGAEEQECARAKAKQRRISPKNWYI